MEILVPLVQRTKKEFKPQQVILVENSHIFDD